LVDLLGDLVDPNYSSGGSTRTYTSPPLSAVQRRLRRDPKGHVRRQGDALTEQEYSAHSPRIQEKFRLMQANGGEIPEHLRTKKFAQKLLPTKWGRTGPSITATSMPDDYVHFSQPRVLTVREWARLQMFPDWYEFSGKRTTGGLRRAGNPREGNFERELPKYTQIGNAVPVNLAEAVGKHLLGVLNRA
jgi:DNA (cytosine-5)-methyltransferase 1